MNESVTGIEDMLEEIQEATEVTTPDKIKKKWRAKVENKTLEPSDLINYFQLSASYFLTVSRKDDGSDIGESSRRRLSATVNCENSRTSLEMMRQRESLDHRRLLSLSISIIRCGEM